jgi:hypothetical protein
LPVNSLATDDRRGAQVIFTFNSHARRQLREKVSSWDLVVTGVAISGDSQLMEDGLQLTECEPAVPIATRGNILEHFESEIPVPPADRNGCKMVPSGRTKSPLRTRWSSQEKERPSKAAASRAEYVGSQPTICMVLSADMNRTSIV